MTSKGELVRAILFPKPIHFRFYTDLVQVTLLFIVIGLGGMIFSVYTWIKNGVTCHQSSTIYDSKIHNQNYFNAGYSKRCNS